MINNRKAFLTMISVSEGTDGHGDNGYNVIVGGALFHDYADHPRVSVDLPRLRIKSTAAGRYQVLAKYFDAYKKQLKLPDFSPESQDKIALQLIKECKALDDIDAGRFAQAVKKCKSRWASLPGAGYGQHENTLARLQLAYVDAGGSLA
jgi:muramidase (phage lysozyme)